MAVLFEKQPTRRPNGILDIAGKVAPGSHQTATANGRKPLEADPAA
jgi:hypothetical protein